MANKPSIPKGTRDFSPIEMVKRDLMRDLADWDIPEKMHHEALRRAFEAYGACQKDLDQFQRKLANYERVRKFTILEKPFTIETGEMTPSLKLKRKVIEERYKELIEDMYKGLEA